MSSPSWRPVLFFLAETPPLSAQTLPLPMSQRCGELLKLFLSMFSPGLSCWSSASLHQLLPITLLLTTDKGLPFSNDGECACDGVIREDKRGIK